jgi:large subunit ribosomal protein L33
MAKKKAGARQYVTLECGTCDARNYRTSKRMAGGTPKLEVQKFCKVCRAHTHHKERKK